MNKNIKYSQNFLTSEKVLLKSFENILYFCSCNIPFYLL